MNKFFVFGSMLIVAMMMLITYLSTPDYFEGRIQSKNCVQTGKSRDSIELVLVGEEHRKIFHFGVKGMLCHDALSLFKLNDYVEVNYHSVGTRFTTVDTLKLNEANIPLRGQ